jgi:hypothetical protein
MKARTFTFLLLIVSVAQAAINIDSFSTLKNDRFSNDPTFIAAGLDLSGVAIADTSANLGAWDDGGRWMTMISPKVFLSVEHASFYPANGESVTFHQSNDPLGLSAGRTVLSSQRIGTSDIRIGVLNAALPASYAYYAYATQALETFSGPGLPSEQFSLSPYYNADAYLLGRSPTAWSTGLDIAVGQNKLDGWDSDVVGVHDAVMAVRDTISSPNYLPSEALLQVGDSGAPVMVDDGAGNLTIVGMNWFIGSSPSFDVNGFSYVGDYAVEIQDYLNAHPVPEVAHFGLVTGLSALFFCVSAVGRRRFRPYFALAPR